MRVSIIINNYNYGQYLGSAISSALSQSYSSVEVIVVDDGSTDNSQEVIGNYTKSIVPVVKPNGGQGSAFNEGLAPLRSSQIPTQVLGRCCEHAGKKY